MTTRITQPNRPSLPYFPTHPEFAYYFEDFQTMFDTFSGDRAVKLQTTTYLPKTVGMEMDTVNGNKHYLSYKTRAIFFDYVKETILGMMGVFWQTPPEINVSNNSEWLQKCTIDGQTFESLYKNVVFNQTLMGRYGMLVDIPEEMDENGKMYPHILEYKGDAIVNWEEVIYKGKKILSWVLLDESSFETDQQLLSTEYKAQWRYCGLEFEDENGNEHEEPIYYTLTGNSVLKDFSLDASYDKRVYPMSHGKTLSYIPFVFVNSTNTKPSMESPPLISLATICLGIYRGDADYREALFKQTLATLFGSGFKPDGPIAVGASTAITTDSKDAKLSFVEIAGAGLSHLKESEKDLKETAQQLGISLLDRSSGDETGASVSGRINNKTSTLKIIARTAAEAMKRVLVIVDDWSDINFGDIDIKPILDFFESSDTADGLQKMWTAYKEGAVTDRDYFNYLKKNGFTTRTNFDVWKKEFDIDMKAKKDWFSGVDEKDEENMTATNVIEPDDDMDSEDE